jgi:hypothetical protein
MICFRASKRANSTNIDNLLEHCDPSPRNGAPRRLEPGSEVAIRIREEVRGRGRFQKQENAANSAFQRVRTGHTTTARNLSESLMLNKSIISPSVNFILKLISSIQDRLRGNGHSRSRLSRNSTLPIAKRLYLAHPRPR